MTATLMAVPKNQELETAAMTLPEKAAATKVVDQVSHDAAAEELKAIARLEKQIVDYHKPFKEQAHKLHKDICTAETALLAPLKAARSTYSQKIVGWENEQRRIQAELQRQAEAEARRLAEEAALQQAAAAEEAGAPDEIVTQILETPQPVFAPKVAPVYQKSAGVVAVATWKAELVDIKATCKAILDGILPDTAVLPNMVLANARARTEKESFKMPGFRAVKEEGTRVSTR
jgi:hypothetical protein